MHILKAIKVTFCNLEHAVSLDYPKVHVGRVISQEENFLALNIAQKSLGQDYDIT